MENLVLRRRIETTERIVHHDDSLARVDSTSECDTLALTSTERSTPTADDRILTSRDLLKIFVQSTCSENGRVPFGIEIQHCSDTAADTNIHVPWGLRAIGHGVNLSL